jgi:hypothetical protein
VLFVGAQEGKDYATIVRYLGNGHYIISSEEATILIISLSFGEFAGGLPPLMITQGSPAIGHLQRRYRVDRDIAVDLPTAQVQVDHRTSCFKSVASRLVSKVQSMALHRQEG